MNTCFLDEIAIYNEEYESEDTNIDNSSFIFWNGNTPSMQYLKTKKITYQGKNIFDIRKDIEQEDLILYIQAYYRFL